MFLTSPFIDQAIALKIPDTEVGAGNGQSRLSNLNLSQTRPKKPRSGQPDR
jgi:hypothetical protein